MLMLCWILGKVRESNENATNLIKFFNFPISLLPLPSPLLSSCEAALKLRTFICVCIKKGMFSLNRHKSFSFFRYLFCSLGWKKGFSLSFAFLEEAKKN